MKDENKLVTLIHRFYALVKLNVLSLICLICGLGIFTIQPVCRASLVVVKNIKEGKIDGYSKIREFFMPPFKEELKNFKSNAAMSAAFLWIIMVLILINRTNSFTMKVTAIIIAYIAVMLILYCLYSQLMDIQLEDTEIIKGSLIEKAAYEFFMPKKLVLSFMLFIVCIILSYKIPVLSIVIINSLYIYIFYTINFSKFDTFYEILKKRRGIL